jgi:formylglycine-generating enzyme required for sulfatase activity
MTELEFEKACRGPNTPTQYEFVWGNVTVNPPSGYSNSGRVDESISPDTSNSNYNNFIGAPVRVGAFARSTTSRTHSGAAYYGIMDLGGDVLERIVTVGNTTGRAFTGSHGNGTLNSSGDATGNSDWPGTDAIGSGFRGGPWDSANDRMRISDRFISALTSATRGSIGTRGFRSVRTAP